MSKCRLIARLDIKNEHLIKGVQLEGLRKLGDPNCFAKNYYIEGIDEIFFLDSVAALYDRNNLYHIVEKACEEVFIPITLGGGIRTPSDIQKALECGADKVAINTAGIKNKDFLYDAARIFGSQCIVASIEAKNKEGGWECYIDNGREETGRKVVEWAQELEGLGVGEILLTSIDQDGTRRGFDLDLIQTVAQLTSVPLIVSGGAGNLEHVEALGAQAAIEGIAIGSLLHYKLNTISEIKNTMLSQGLKVRL